MTQPLISVIVPAFNGAEYIRRCVASILAQTHRNLELIVVNDCSQDATGVILDTLAREDPRLRAVHLPINAGVHGARAAGLKEARGQWVGFVDSDDWIAPGMYQALLAEAANARSDIVLCSARTAYGEDRLAGHKVRFPRARRYEEELLRRFCDLEFGSGVLWNKLYRAELIQSHGSVPLERAVDAAEDYIVNFGCFAEAARVSVLPESHYYYFCRPDSASRAASASRNFARLIRAYVVCLETYAPQNPDHAAAIDRLYSRQIGFDSYRIASPRDLAERRSALAESLERLARVHPEGIYALSHALGSVDAPAGTEVQRARRELIGSARGFVRALRRAFRARSAGPVAAPAAESLSVHLHKC